MNGAPPNSTLFPYPPLFRSDIAVGYSISSQTVYPGIRYAGRLAGDPAGLLSQGEATLKAGTGVETDFTGRWGDYSSMSVDRKSTRLNSSHSQISYAGFCLQK